MEVDDIRAKMRDLRLRKLELYEMLADLDHEDEDDEGAREEIAKCDTRIADLYMVIQLRAETME